MNNNILKPLESTLPYAIARNDKAKEISRAVDFQLQMISEETKSILLLPNLDILPESIIDILAWQYHVDFYSQNLNVERKRELLRNSIANHRIKGTPAAVEAVVKAVFTSGRVFENWEYDGEPYHFQIRLIEEQCSEAGVIRELLRAIDSAKNVRSWCDGLFFIRRSEAKINYSIGHGVFKTIRLYPAKLNIPPTTNNIGIGISVAQFRCTVVQ